MSDEFAVKGRSASASRALSRAHRFLSSIKKWWWVPIITAGVGVALAAWNDSKKAPSYISKGRMMVSGRIALPEGAVYSEELSNFYGTQSELMQSQKVRQRAAARVETVHPELQASAVSISVSQQQGTSFFVLTAIGDKPDYTQAYLDACMEEYIRTRRELRQDTSETALTSITDQLLKLEKDIESGTEELLAFRKSNNVPLIEQEGNSAARNLSALNQKLEQLQREFQLLTVMTLDQNLERKQEKGTGSEGSDSPGSLNSGPLGAEGEYLRAKQELQLRKAEKERYSKKMRAKHPMIMKLDSEIQHQESLISLFKEQSLLQLENKKEAIRLEIENLEAAIKVTSEKALELTRQISEFDRLKAKVERAKALSERLLSSITGIDMGTNLHADVVTVMETATHPTATKLGFAKDLTTGGVAGLLVGFGILFLAMLLDDRIISADELQERFPEDLLGQVPKEITKGRLNLLTIGEKQHVFAESYRNLRSTLHFMSFEETRPKTMLITSAVPGEGKSTVAANLAITIAGGGAKTLLIDGDLRKGVAHEYFSVEASPGLSSVLTEQAVWRESVIATGVANLSLLPRGKVIAGTSEHFLSKNTDRLLQEVYKEYDCIIVDSAPVLANDDTASLAPKIDATLFVVRAGVSSARLTRSALDALGKRQVNVLGLILNAADGKSAEYYYYHKYGEYYAQPSDSESS